jgi:hypothetical protein
MLENPPQITANEFIKNFDISILELELERITAAKKQIDDRYQSF